MTAQRADLHPCCSLRPIDIRQSTILPTSSPNSAASAKCHRLTLSEKTVLAKRTHLTPPLQDEKRDRTSTPLRMRRLAEDAVSAGWRPRLFYESPCCVNEVAGTILFSFEALRSAMRSPGPAGGREWAPRSLVGTRPPQPGGRGSKRRPLVGPVGPDVPIFRSADVAAGVPFFYPSLSRLSTR
jgi:hypothetical protein